MINYVMKYYDKLLTALFEHLQLVVLSMFFSLCVVSILLVFCIYFHALQNLFVSITSMLYSIPSLAMFAILIPLTGLGKTTAIVSTIGIGTIAASINAGGLGTILFDGLRTLNTNKIIIGSILSASLAIVAHYGLRGIEIKLDKKFSESK